MEVIGGVVGTLIGFVIFGGFGLLMLRDPGPCGDEWRTTVKVAAPAYKIYTCDRRKGHETDHRDYREEVGWPNRGAA